MENFVEKETQKVSLWDIFFVFLKIGTFTVGGGYAMIPLIQQALDKKKWISPAELPDIVALSQSAPGVLAVNISIFAGYRLRKVPGSVVATLGSVLPSFVVILLIAMFFVGYQNNPAVIKIFNGIRPAVISLILVPTINMARQGNKSLWSWAISACTIISISVLNISPLLILCFFLACAIIYTVVTKFYSKTSKTDI